jgi:hypothetical protein
MKSIQDIIDIAKVSEYLCNVDISRKGLYGGGRDLMLPYKINNIRKSVEFLKGYETVPDVPAISIVTINDAGTPGDTVSISIDDPILGFINFITYEIQSYDVTIEDLISHLVASFVTSYGYTVSSNANNLIIQAPSGRGASMNGLELVCDYISIDASSTPFANGVTAQDNTKVLRDQANYLYALCAAYSLQAANTIGIIDNNAIARPVTIGALITPIRITSANFVDSTHWNGANSVGQIVASSYRLQVFANFIARYLVQGTEWERTTSGINILIDGFDALTNEYEFYIDISL